jgi:hypothetical protein
MVPLFNSTILPTTLKVLETFLKAILWNPLQLFHRNFNDVSSITKAPASSLQCWFQSREQVKISCSQIRRGWRKLKCCRIVLRSEILDQNRPLWWSIVVKEKPIVGSHLFWGFPSDRIPRGTKGVNVHFFIHSNN